VGCNCTLIGAAASSAAERGVTCLLSPARCPKLIPLSASNCLPFGFPACVSKKVLPSDDVAADGYRDWRIGSCDEAPRHLSHVLLEVHLGEDGLCRESRLCRTDTYFDE
jgi:hypothetical protein